MNDLALAVFIASGAGWYAGHYFERRKARAAFQDLIGKCTFATTTVANAAVALIMKKLPDGSPDLVIKDLLAECHGMGMQAVALTTQQAREQGLIRDPNDKA
jgi:hypothetical protein